MFSKRRKTFSLLPHAIRLLREAGADAYLPLIDTHAAKIKRFMHICSDSTKSTKKTLLIDVAVDRDCLTCTSSPQWKLLEKFQGSLEDITAILVSLVNAEYVVNCMQQGIPDPPPEFGHSLTSLRVTIPERIAASSFPDELLPLLENISIRVGAAEEIIKTFLSSKDGKDLIEEYEEECGSSSEWDSTKNALLIVEDPASNYAVALAEAYGVRVAPEKFLIKAPVAILQYLNGNSISSALYLDAFVPDVVLQTMGALWDPDSKAALGDASKALQAAWELTPRLAYS